MKIALVSEHASPLALPGSTDSGGQNVHVAALAQSLAHRGHHITVYTRRDDPNLQTRVPFAPSVDVVHLTAGPQQQLPKDELLPHMGEFAQALAASWSFEKPDVVHSHFWMSGLASLDAARQLASPPPVAHTYHALGTVKRRFQGRADTSPAERVRIEAAIGAEADVIIATCPDEVYELALMGVPGSRIDVVPCGVDSVKFSGASISEERGAQFRLVSVGRLVPRKGVDLAIEALAQLVYEDRYDAELEIVGSGETGESTDPEVARLAQIARDLDVSDRVHLRGRMKQEHIPALLRSADAVVCTPWYEPFGIVPLEAMACSVPVIVADVGGLQDSVLDGVTGFHVPPRDAPAIAAAAAQLFDDAPLRRAMGVAGRTRVNARYTWESVAARTEAVYKRLLINSGHLERRYEGVTA